MAQRPSGEADPGAPPLAAGGRGRDLLVWGGLGLLVVAALALVWRERSAAARPAELGESFVYSIERFREVDPKLLQYRESGRIESGLRIARGLALAPDGRLWVAGDRALRCFDPQGTLKRQVPLPGEARAVAVQGERVYVALPDRVVVLDTQGAQLALWPSLGPTALLTALALTGDSIFLADSGNRVVWRRDLQGQPQGEWGRKDLKRGIQGLIVPSPHLDLALGGDGLIQVTNPGRHLVEGYTPAGDRATGWGQASMRIEGFSGCCNPVAIARLGDGRIVTSEKGLARVKLLDEQGTLQAVVAAPKDFGENAFGIDLAVDGQDAVLILDSGTCAVRRFVPKDRVTK